MQQSLVSKYQLNDEDKKIILFQIKRELDRLGSSHLNKEMKALFDAIKYNPTHVLDKQWPAVEAYFSKKKNPEKSRLFVNAFKRNSSSGVANFKRIDPENKLCDEVKRSLILSFRVAMELHRKYKYGVTNKISQLQFEFSESENDTQKEWDAIEEFCAGFQGYNRRTQREKEYMLELIKNMINQGIALEKRGFHQDSINTITIALKYTKFLWWGQEYTFAGLAKSHFELSQKDDTDGNYLAALDFATKIATSPNDVMYPMFHPKQRITNLSSYLAAGVKNEKRVKLVKDHIISDKRQHNKRLMKRSFCRKADWLCFPLATGAGVVVSLGVAAAAATHGLFQIATRRHNDKSKIDTLIDNLHILSRSDTTDEDKSAVIKSITNEYKKKKSLLASSKASEELYGLLTNAFIDNNDKIDAILNYMLTMNRHRLLLNNGKRLFNIVEKACAAKFNPAPDLSNVTTPTPDAH